MRSRALFIIAMLFCMAITNPTSGLIELESTSGSDARSGSEVAGWVDLTFSGNLSQGGAVDGIYSALRQMNLNGMGLSSMDNASMGIDWQVDNQLGDGDGNISVNEWDGFVAHLTSENYSEIPHIWLDDNPLSIAEGMIISDVINLTTLPHTVGENGSFSYLASGNFSTTRNNMPQAQLRISQGTDGLFGHPVSIHLDSPLEFRWAPESVSLNGTPTDFTVDQSFESLAIFYSITIGDNSAPSLSFNSPPSSDTAIEWSTNATFSASTYDVGIDSLTCEWLFVTPSANLSLAGNSVNLTPSEVPGWQMGQYMQATFSCSDHHASTAEVNHTWGLDGMPPSVMLVNATLGCGEGNFTIEEVNLLDCDVLNVPAGFRFTLDVEAGDDFTTIPHVIWSSDKTPDWWQEGERISILFYQGEGVNGFDDDLPDRHTRKENSSYVLNLTVTDDAGHPWQMSWPVRLLDNQPPTVRVDLWVGDSMIDSGNLAIAGDEIRVDLNDSFDDIDAITDVRWWVTLDDEAIPELQDVGWDEARTFMLGSLSSGHHNLNITAMDTTGNYLTDFTYDVQVQPETMVDLEIISVYIDTQGTWDSGIDTARFTVKVKNEGGQFGPFQLCVAAECVNQTSVAANADGPGISNHVFEVPVDPGRNIEVVAKWVDSDGDSHQHSLDTGEELSRPYSGAEKFAIMVGIGVAVLGFHLLTKRKD